MLSLRISFVFLFFVSACATDSKKEAGLKLPKTAPKFKLDSELSSMRPTSIINLENGLKIYFVEDKSLPRISLHLLVKTGVLNEEKPGLNALASDLLESGTQKRSASEIADQLGSLGTDITISSGYDFTYIATDSLSETSEILLDIFSDLVLYPAFTESEITRTKRRYLDAIAKKKDNPDQLANDSIIQYLFNEHPYGRDPIGTAESIKEIKKKDIIKHYLTYYRPNNAMIAVVGSFDNDFKQKVISSFSDWQKKNIKSIPAINIESTNGIQVKFLSKNGLSQSQIRFASMGISRSDPEFLKLRIANEVLGRGFVSRLNTKLRIELGLTYSIYSSFDARKESGPFTISTFTKNDSVEKTVDETLLVYKDFIEKGVTAEELAAAKAMLIGQFPKGIETADRYAFNLLALDYYGIPSNYLVNYNKLVQQITLEQVNTIIKAKLDPNNMKILVYGDAKSLKGQLEKYKPLIEVVR